MIDFSRIEKYRENNRIEAKRASGGFPGSVWETYSAFANTLGGIILLGVEERKDKSLHPVELPDAEALVDEFWRLVNDPRKVSVNILRRDDVAIECVDGKKIVAITVPRARREDKPIYIDGDFYKGSYRRNGEGDYRCEREEVDAMLRDAALETDDMRAIKDGDASLVKLESIERFARGCAGSVSCETKMLAKSILGAEADRLTLAHLMMFGRGEEIRKRIPEFSAIYRNFVEEIVFENLCDFFFYATERFIDKLESLSMRNENDVFRALREALVNSIVNADYRSEGGVVVEEGAREIRFINAGGFRIDPNGVKRGGISDPRNRGLIRIISSVGSAKGAGMGIPGIYTVWKRYGWKEPVFKEEFSPDRITLTLSFDKRIAKSSDGSDAIYREMMIAHLTKNVSASADELAYEVGVEIERAERILSILMFDGIVVLDEASKKFRLKS